MDGCEDGVIEGGGPGGTPSARESGRADAAAAAEAGSAAPDALAGSAPAQNPLLADEDGDGDESTAAAAAAAAEAAVDACRSRRSATDSARMVSTVRGGEAGAAALLAPKATWCADSSDPDDEAAADSAESGAPPGASLDSSLDEVDCEASPAARALRAISIARTSSTDCAR